ncbi:MAG: hypothetical protein I8H68_05715 [Flavobacteriia bacterium]|nr:hypothetical protein [Flavobacteriia bacterium]MBH2024292.1 hypothetical protein [Flavobacteriales bacterium]
MLAAVGGVSSYLFTLAVKFLLIRFRIMITSAKGLPIRALSVSLNVKQPQFSETRPFVGGQLRRRLLSSDLLE